METNFSIIEDLSERHRRCREKGEKRIIKRLINILRHCSVIHDGKMHQVETLDDLLSVHLDTYENTRGLGIVTHEYLQNYLAEKAEIQFPGLQIISDYKPQTASFYEYFMEQGINGHVIRSSESDEDGYYKSARFSTEAECALYLNKNHISREKIITISIEPDKGVWMLYESCV